MGTRTANMPLFIARDSAGDICGIYQAGAADRLNFRAVYGIARNDARECNGTVEITCTARFDI